MDGGSTDGTIDIIKKYDQHIDFWKSNQDDGQTAALKKGFDISHGEILGWVNSDDVLLENALKHIASAYINKPRCGFFGGDCLIIDEKGLIVKVLKGTRHAGWFGQHGFRVRNPVWFFTRWAFEQVGGLNNEFEYVMDTDLFFRMALEHLEFVYIPCTLSAFRIHSSSKTVFKKELMQEELKLLLDRQKNDFKGPIPVRSLRWIYRGLQIINGDYYWRYYQTSKFKKKHWQDFSNYSRKCESNS